MKHMKQLGFTIANFLFITIATTFIFSLIAAFIFNPSASWLIVVPYFVPFIWAIAEYFILNMNAKKKTFHTEVFMSVVFAQIYLLLLGYIYLITVFA